MASERQRAANRANAKKSTGPKSRGGKIRASRNAFRHGLAARPPNDVDWRTRLDKLAGEIADSTGMSFADACSIAHAELEVQRAREVMNILSGQLSVGKGHTGCTASSPGRYLPVASPPLPVNNISHLVALVQELRTLKKLERYLIRALSRRDRTVYGLSDEAFQWSPRVNGGKYWRLRPPGNYLY